MKFSKAQVAALVVGVASAQTLNIPTRSGEIISLPAPSTITGAFDGGNREFDRGQACDSDEDTGSDNAVFILENGASLSNVIIGADALEGVHCLGDCTITNVWFRDVCEDAISVLGTGNALIKGGGAQEAKDKVVQHNGRGTVTIEDYTIVNAGKLYRSCGDCTDNESKSPRNVIVKNVRAYGMTSDLIGINSNFGDTAIIDGSCGTTKAVCREYKGVNKGSGSSSKLETNDSCKGAQGKLAKLPECGAAQATGPAATTGVTSPSAASPAPTTLVTKISTTKKPSSKTTSKKSSTKKSSTKKSSTKTKKTSTKVKTTAATATPI